MISGIALLADDPPKLTEPVASGTQLILAFLCSSQSSSVCSPSAGAPTWGVTRSPSA